MANIDAPIPVILPVQLPPAQSVNPAAAAQAMLTPEPGDRWTALKQIGWWKPIDSLILVALAANLITGFFFLVFGRLTANVAIIGLLNELIMLAAWAVIIGFRCMDFVVQLRANIEMLPFDSARIAVGFIKGGSQQ